MIVFNLACSHGHPFEGWFASSVDFEKQQLHGMVACPVCGDLHVEKGMSAPRLNLGHSSHEASHTAVPEQQAYLGTQEMVMRQFKEFLFANTENVGAAFAETARKMHYGEEHHRNIRGIATQEVVEELQEEGIETMSIPQGIVLDDSVQ
jgi:hypothetical protein